MTLAKRRRQRRKPIPPNVCRVSEASALTGISPSTIYRWIRLGQLDPHRSGRMLYVDVDDVRQQQQRNKPAHTGNPPPEGMVTVRRASTNTGASVQSIREWAAAGLIAAQRHGPKMWYVDLEDCQRLAETMRTGPKPQT